MKELVEKYNYLIENYPFKSKYYHLRSLNNFIENFDNIKDYNDKEKAFELLDNCLNYSIDNEINNLNECKIIYKEFIVNIGKLYKKNMNFKMTFHTSSVLINCFVVSLICVYLKANILIFITVFIAHSYFLFSVYSNKKKNIVYGLNY